MKIEILASDSLGVRSMATCVEAGGHKILIDPGAALGPKRYGLPPHRFEFERLRFIRDLIKRRAKESDIIIITHYHHDHYNPEDFEIYEGKIVYLKDPQKNINRNQKRRAELLIKNIKARVKVLEVAEGRSFKFNGLELIFSEACPHGINERLGCVVQVLIKDKNLKFAYTSDIQGAPLKVHLDFLLFHKPDIIFMDGPPLYLGKRVFPEEALKDSIKNIKLLISEINPKYFILDHHITRDLSFNEKVEGLYNNYLITAASFMGKRELLLEAKRKDLWKANEACLQDN